LLAERAATNRGMQNFIAWAVQLLQLHSPEIVHKADLLAAWRALLHHARKIKDGSTVQNYFPNRCGIKRTMEELQALAFPEKMASPVSFIRKLELPESFIHADEGGAQSESDDARGGQWDQAGSEWDNGSGGGINATTGRGGTQRRRRPVLRRVGPLPPLSPPPPPPPPPPPAATDRCDSQELQLPPMTTPPPQLPPPPPPAAMAIPQTPSRADSGQQPLQPPPLPEAEADGLRRLLLDRLRRRRLAPP
jgi:hypothetical protein